MGISENECVLRRDKLLKSIIANRKAIECNIDLKVIPTITTEWQYKAYKRLKKSQEIQKSISCFLKVFSELSVISGFIVVIAQIFVM